LPAGNHIKYLHTQKENDFRENTWRLGGVETMFEQVGSLLVSLGLLTPHCSNELFVKWNVLDGACFSLLVSKGLSLLIIVGSFVLKLPQILALLKARNSEGLTFTMFGSETFIFCVAAAYGMRMGFPASTYFENWVILAQTVVIVALMFHYKGQQAAAGVFIAGVALFLGALLFVLPLNIVSLFFSSIIPILIYGRAPQIWSNYQRKNTGALSLLSLAMSFGGGLARIFTTLKEAPSTLNVLGLVIGVLLNLTLILQILAYGGGRAKAKAKKNV
jgi:mannose-P-dolichol utilization defect protein 1